jgi:hypothetical protein
VGKPEVGVFSRGCGIRVAGGLRGRIATVCRIVGGRMGRCPTPQGRRLARQRCRTRPAAGLGAARAESLRWRSTY